MYAAIISISLNMNKLIDVYIYIYRNINLHLYINKQIYIYIYIKIKKYIMYIQNIYHLPQKKAAPLGDHRTPGTNRKWTIARIFFALQLEMIL